MPRVTGGGEDRSRFLSWLMAWGGAVALVISIGTGIYTFYTNEIRKPEEERLVSFQTKISGINAINQETQAKLSATNDSMEKMAIVNAANNQKYILVNEAERIFSEISNKKELNPYDLYVLATENSMMGKFDAMDKYIALADENTKNSDDYLLVANVLTWKGKAALARMGPSGLEVARGFYEQAEAELGRSTVPGVHVRRATLYGEMAMTEANIGDCDRAEQNKKKFDDEIAIEANTPDGQNVMQITQRILALQTRCPIS